MRIDIKDLISSGLDAQAAFRRAFSLCARPQSRITVPGFGELPTSGVVFVPAGLYELHATLAIPLYVHLQGEGQTSVLAFSKGGLNMPRQPDSNDLVFCHPTKGTPLEASSLATRYLKPALARAGIEKPFRPFHDLRHTSLTHAAAAGNPQIYVQARAGHSQSAITERYMHAAQVLFPGAAERSEARMFGSGGDQPGQHTG
jgi:hypothetical protein